MSVLVIGWCVFALMLTGVVKGVLGVGLPLVSLPLLTLAVPVPFAVALLPLPMLVTNVWQSVGSGYFPYAVRRLWPLLIAMFVGALIGAEVLAGVDVRGLNALVGTMLIVFSVTTMMRPTLRLSPGAEPWAGAAAGGLGGVLGGITGVFGAPLLVFLSALNLDKDRFVGCVTTMYLGSSFALFAALVRVDLMHREQIIGSALAIAPLFLGVLVGERLRGRMDERIFRGLLTVVLVGGGAQLLWRAATG